MKLFVSPRLAVFIRDAPSVVSSHKYFALAIYTHDPSFGGRASACTVPLNAKRSPLRMTRCAFTPMP